MNAETILPTTQEIREHFATKYASSPKEIKPYQYRILKNSDYCCDNCSKSIFDMWDFPVIDNGGVLCEECDNEINYSTCPICEDSYPNATGPKDTFFVVSKESASEVGVRAGFYKVLKFPYFLSCVVFGFESLFEGAVQIVRECDINGMLSKIYGRRCAKVTANECCPDCFEKYANLNPVTTLCDKKHQRFVNKVIKAGK